MSVSTVNGIGDNVPITFGLTLTEGKQNVLKVKLGNDEAIVFADKRNKDYRIATKAEYRKKLGDLAGEIWTIHKILYKIFGSFTGLVKVNDSELGVVFVDRSKIRSFIKGSRSVDENTMEMIYELKNCKPAPEIPPRPLHILRPDDFKNLTNEELKSRISEGSEYVLQSLELLKQNESRKGDFDSLVKKLRHVYDEIYEDHEDSPLFENELRKYVMSTLFEMTLSSRKSVSPVSSRHNSPPAPLPPHRISDADSPSPRLARSLSPTPPPRSSSPSVEAPDQENPALQELSSKSNASRGILLKNIVDFQLGSLRSASEREISPPRSSPESLMDTLSSAMSVRRDGIEESSEEESSEEEIWDD